MAKKQFGKLAVLAALAGTAVGITYFLRYKSFHEELEEDFHDFEEDLDEFDSKEEEASAKRNYVSLTPEKADSAQKETVPASAKEHPAAEQSPEAEKKADETQNDFLDSDMEFLDDEPMDGASIFDEEDIADTASSSATTLVEDEEPEQEWKACDSMIQSLMRSLDLLEVLKGADHKISIA